MPLLDPNFNSHSHAAPDSAAPDANATQPLPPAPDDDGTTGNLWTLLASPLRWPRTTLLGLAATGGALAVAAVSLLVGALVGGAEAPRSFFGPAQTPRPNSALQIVDPRAPQTSIEPLDSSAASEEAKSNDENAPLYQPANVDPDARLNADGTGLSALSPQTDEDRRRLQRRHEEDRLLREQRRLEDKKRAIEAEIAAKQLEVKRAEDNRQMMEAREQEDKKRLDDRIAEDARLLDERRQAEKQSVEDQQRALNDQAQKLAQATP